MPAFVRSEFYNLHTYMCVEEDRGVYATTQHYIIDGSSTSTHDEQYNEMLLSVADFVAARFTLTFK